MTFQTPFTSLPAAAPADSPTGWPPGFPAPPARPEGPGYVVRGLLGFGGHGEVWLGEDQVTGEAVALKIGRLPGADPPSPGSGAGPPDGDAAASLDREIALLARIQDDHVVRLRQVVPVVGGGHALVLEYAPGGNLGALVAARGALDPAEVTTILVPLGQALERLHGRGLVHGDLSPGNVLFAHDGRPLLSDLGVSRLLGAAGPGPQGTPGFVDPAVVHGVDPRASDVWALAALGWFALTGRPPGEPVDAARRTAVDVAAPALTRLLAEVLGADPPGRPSPGELAHRAWTAVPPAPIRLLTGRDPEAAASASRTTRQAVPSPARDEAGAGKDRDLPRAVRRRRDVRNDRASDSARARRQRVRPAASGEPRDRRRLRSGGTVAVLVVGVLAALGVTWWAADLRGIGSDPPADRVRVTAEQAAAPRDVPDVERVLAAIGRARAKAFSTASAAPLVGADEPGSAAMAADQAVVGGLADRGWRLAGVTFAISDVRVVHRDVRTATVTARVTTSAHLRVTADGAVVQTVAAEKPRRVTLSLVSVPGAGWRVRAVS